MSDLEFKFDWDQIRSGDTEYADSFPADQIAAIQAALDFPEPSDERDSYIRISPTSKNFAIFLLVMHKLQSLPKGQKILVFFPAGPQLKNFVSLFLPNMKDPATVATFTRLAACMRTTCEVLEQHLYNVCHQITSYSTVQDIRKHPVLLASTRTFGQVFKKNHTPEDQAKIFSSFNTNLEYMVIGEYNPYRSSASAKFMKQIQSWAKSYCGFTEELLDIKPMYDSINACAVVAHKISHPVPFVLQGMEGKIVEMLLRQLSYFVSYHCVPAKAIVCIDSPFAELQKFCDYANSYLSSTQTQHPLFPQRLYKFYACQPSTYRPSDEWDFIVHDGSLHDCSDPWLFLSFALGKRFEPSMAKVLDYRVPYNPKYPTFTATDFRQTAHVYYLESLEADVAQTSIPTESQSLVAFYMRQHAQKLISSAARETAPCLTFSYADLEPGITKEAVLGKHEESSLMMDADLDLDMEPPFKKKTLKNKLLSAERESSLMMDTDTEQPAKRKTIKAKQMPGKCKTRVRPTQIRGPVSSETEEEDWPELSVASSSSSSIILHKKRPLHSIV